MTLGNGDAVARPSPTLVDWVRRRLSAPVRRRVRALTDPIAGPLGSIRSVHTSVPLVGLTFDDGPDPAYTPRILDILSSYGATATWFVLVDRAEKNQDIIARMLSAGHDVGLHGLDHSRLTRLKMGELSRHVSEGVNRLAALTGQLPRFFRPPYGSQSLLTFLAVRRLGMESVVWSSDCDDWTQHPEESIAERAVDAAFPGRLLLLHDSIAADPQEYAHHPVLKRDLIAELIMQGLASRGLRGASLSELLNRGSAHRTLWFRP